MPLDRNVGFGAANNVALRTSGAPLVLLLNSDTVVTPGAIDTLAERLAETGAVAAGPRLVDRDGRPEISHGRMLTPWTELGPADPRAHGGQRDPRLAAAVRRPASSPANASSTGSAARACSCAATAAHRRWALRRAVFPVRGRRRLLRRASRHRRTHSLHAALADRSLARAASGGVARTARRRTTTGAISRSTRSTRRDGPRGCAGGRAR